MEMTHEIQLLLLCSIGSTVQDQFTVT